MTNATTTSVPAVELLDGTTIPQLGYGVFQSSGESVRTAIEAGYRMIDTAMIYENEDQVGQQVAAVVESGDLAREDLYITTKLWNDDQGRESALKAIDTSLGKLGMEYVDLYLIHWPCPKQDKYVESWKALEEIKASGKARSIGVSNFTVDQLQEIIDLGGELPVVNQIELHPFFQQKELREFHAKHGIVTQAWSPLGQAKNLDDETIVAIADKHGVTPAQAVIRWHLQLGNVLFPKSDNAGRIAQNIDVFGFELDAEDMAAMEKLDSAEGRIGPDPLAFG